LHLHGLFFMPSEENHQSIRPMTWKDTLNVHIDGTIRFVVLFVNLPRLTGLADEHEPTN
jgi:hypothetical protein